MRGHVLAALLDCHVFGLAIQNCQFHYMFHLGCNRQLWNHDCCFGSETLWDQPFKRTKTVNWALRGFDSSLLIKHTFSHVSSVILCLFEKHIGSDNVSALVQVPWSDGCKDLLRKVLPASFYWSVHWVLGFWWFLFAAISLASLGSCSTLWAQQVSYLSLLSWLLVAVTR